MNFSRRRSSSLEAPQLAVVGSFTYARGTYLKGRSLYPGPAEKLYKALDKDERVKFLQEIVDRKNLPKTNLEDKVSDGYETLFETILGAIESKYQEALIDYVQ